MLLKFETPLTGDEAEDRFELLEDRGDRILVRSAVYCLDWELKPTFVYPRAELVPVE